MFLILYLRFANKKLVKLPRIERGVPVLRDIVVNNFIRIVRKNTDYDELKIAEIKYGLESIYLLISKSIIIVAIAIYLKIFKEFIIFTILYNFVRMPSFGLHATKSWICLLSSILIFILTPYLAMFIKLNYYVISILGIVLILLFYKNAPADTKKRPIVSPKRRLIYKFITVSISIIYVFLAIFIKNTTLSNLLILSLIVQNLMISPFVYKLFHLPYNNYINYIKEGNQTLV